MSGPLNIQLKDVDTSYPSPAVGQVLSRLSSWELKESNNSAGLWMIKATFATEEPYNDTKGKALPPGFKFTSHITLPGAPDAEAETEEIRHKSLASFVDAMRGSDDQASRPDFTDEVMNGFINEPVLVVFKKSKDTTFGDTQVGSYKAVPKAE